VKGLSGILSRYLTFDRFGLSQMVPTHTSLDSKSSLFLQPRQIFGNNTVNPANNPFNNGGFPVPYLAFGIAAIALFVLVVAFVLLRIFVRNRRLRRMGIYPEGPIDRLLGGNFREFDDNLPPPRLWEAKITDIGAGMTEKHGLDGEKANSIDTKGYGWDALMPVSAALPPNLYPIIFQADQKNHSSSFEPPSTYPPPPSNQHTARLGRHMPQFLRRQTGDAADPINGATNAPPSATTADFPTASASNAEKAEEKLAASVNVTVLIAMPSSRTIFPSSRRVASSMSNNGTDPLRQPSATLSTTDTKLPEVEEDVTLDQDESSMKGKARKAPSLRSVKSTASLKSVAETRREAFFNQITKDDAGKDIPSENIVATPAPAYEEEEEELPELMFGTASVPIFTHLATNTTSRRQSLTPSSHVMQPNRSDILGLVAAANKARERKTEVDAAAAGAKTKKQQDEADLEVNRLSVAETSLDGEARTGLNDRSEDDALQTPMADQNPGQQFEMTTMGPSRSSYYSTEMPTPSTPTPLLSMASPFGTAPKTPTSSMPLVSSGLKEDGHRT
jgi:hypothetical protein